MGRVARIDFPRDGIIDYLGSRQKERLFRENTITQLVIISKVGMYVAQRARSQKKKKKKKVFRDICASPFKNQVRVFSAATWIECGMPKYPSHGKKKVKQQKTTYIP